MANATTAPLKKEQKIIKIWEGSAAEDVVEGSKEHFELTREFDPFKKYMFELANENMERELPVMIVRGTKSFVAPHQRFKPYQNIVLTSQIIWKGQRRILRYYDGCETIFADKQSKEKETIDQFVKQTKHREFLEGKFGCYGDERMLLIYLNLCSWNAKSEFRTRSADAVFVSVNPDESVKLETSKLDQIDQARELAKTATETKMLIHANYLGIPTMDYDSGNELSPDEIRIAYRKAAIRDAKGFIESYGNKKIEIKYYINKALTEGLINNKFNPNKATWAKSNSDICDISGLRTTEGIAEKLFEFSSLPEGEEFLIQLKALYE